MVSQRPKLRPNPQVLEWLQRTRDEDTYISVVTIEEIRFGLEDMDPGPRRYVVERWLKSDVLVGFGERILPVDRAVAEECGRLRCRAKKEKHTAALADSLIAATASVYGMQVATLNRKDFERLGVEIVEF